MEPAASSASAAESTAKSSAASPTTRSIIPLTICLISRGAVTLLVPSWLSSPADVARPVSSESSAASASPTLLTILVVSVLLFIISALSLRSISTSAHSPASVTSVRSSPAIRSIGASFHGSSFGSRDIGCFIPLLSDDNIKLNDLSVTNRSHCFLWIVLDNSSLVDEDVFLGVIPVDETISRFYVKPLDCSGDFRGYHLLWFLRFDIASLLLVRLALRVIHDGNVVWMVTSCRSESSNIS